MEENGIITGQIPVTGNGVHKTYEESIIRMYYAGSISSYNNEYYIDNNGSLVWCEKEKDYEQFIEGIQNEELKPAVILNIFRSDCYTVVEYIDSNSLRQHLIAEAVMRNQAHQEIENNNVNNSTNSNYCIFKTYPESIFRIVEPPLYQIILEKSSFGVYIRKKDGCLIIPLPDEEYGRKIESYIDYYDYLEGLEYICSHLDEYDVVEIIKTYYNDKNNTYFVELVDKDIYKSYVQYKRKLKF